MSNLIHEVVRLLRLSIGREVSRKVDIRLPCRHLGSAYGGWVIGSNALNSDAIVYSAGVGEDVSFDLALIEEYGIVVHAFDPTPRSIEWIHKQNLPQRFVLHEFGLADVDGSLSFHPPADPSHISHSIIEKPGTGHRVAIDLPVRRLSTTMTQLGHTRIDLLKMDIEGSEYAVIRDMLDSGIRPAQLLVEFHHRFPRIGAKTTRATMRLLRAAGYRLFSVSNTAEEFSFMRAT